MTTACRHAVVDGIKLFYREAGRADAPALLMLHGFPTSSHMFRELIPLLADRYRIIAPDLPGFGFSDAPDVDGFKYTFDNLAGIIDRFTEAVGLKRYAIYVFDYGAPVGFRLALAHPDRVTAIISQNGNAYLEGLSEGWNPIQTYWKEPTPENRFALRAFLYASNVALYPKFQDYFRKHRPPLLAVWGRNDPFFLPPGAEAFRRDIPKAEVLFFDTGHFALETHVTEIADAIGAFLARHVA
jgi:pimeloyl-ACP methyl ester carboxylesterase